MSALLLFGDKAGLARRGSARQVKRRGHAVAQRARSYGIPYDRFSGIAASAASDESASENHVSGGFFAEGNSSEIVFQRASISERRFASSASPSPGFAGSDGPRKRSLYVCSTSLRLY